MCHTVAAGAKSTVGPNLHALWRRPAGSLDGFAYSEAMKNSGIVWDEASLKTFLRDPKAAIPGNRMAFPGIKGESEVENLLAYLREVVQ